MIGPTELLIMLFIFLIPIIGMGKTYEKANKPGWAVVVPIYNFIVLLEIIDKPLWWIIFYFIPIINIIWLIIGLILLSVKFGKSTGFILGMIFLFPIFILILGFDNSKYQN
jgi:hypothetical protein